MRESKKKSQDIFLNLFSIKWKWKHNLPIRVWKFVVKAILRRNFSYEAKPGSLKRSVRLISTSQVKKKREWTQISDIRNEKKGHHYKSHEHQKGNKGIPWITLCPQIGHLDEMDQFLERDNLPKFSPEETDECEQASVC